jgi:uncharacterized protein (DUF433 family)
MAELIECNPEILGGKPVIKGTRIPLDLIFELVGLNYSIDQILEEYPTLSRPQLLNLIKLGKDIQKNLGTINLERYLEKELAQS